MRFMLLIYGDEKILNDQERQACYVESATLTQQLNSAGKYVSAAPLSSVSTAASVRVRGGKPLITDGPFAETYEQLGGYFMVEAKDIEEATEIAAKIPGARWGTVEVRPVVEISGLPDH